LAALHHPRAPGRKDPLNEEALEQVQQSNWLGPSSKNFPSSETVASGWHQQTQPLRTGIRMDQTSSKGLVKRPVTTPVTSSDPSSSLKPSFRWPEGAHGQAVALQRQLALGDRDWHALKGQRSRRAAEQLAAALVLLLGGDEPAANQPGPARLAAIDLVENGLGWLKGELVDPGCPSHRPVSAIRPAAD
jgi:hypothetical protein